MSQTKPNNTVNLIGELFMKAKGLLTAVLLVATNFAWAQGGLSIDNVAQHMNSNNWINAQTEGPEVVAQGRTDKFNVEIPTRKRELADTNKLKQSYDGQS